LEGVASLSAFPKSGVTYLSFLLFYSLFDDGCDIHDLERKYIIDIHAYPNADFAYPLAPRVIKSHFSYNPTVPAVRLTSKAIYLIRHPIDVMMSAWDFGGLISGAAPDTRSPALRSYVQRWLVTGGDYPPFGAWVQHVRSWLGQQNIPVHLVTYQNLVDNPELELKRILEFLGIQVQAARQRIAIERSSMKSMAALESQEVENRVDGIFFRDGLAKGYGQGHRFINKGYRNSYQTVLTSEERLLADRTFGVEIARYLGSQP
jgi:Sulfotransferase domain